MPEVPVMFTVEVPVAAVLFAVSVRVLVLVVLLGLKDAVTPLGMPEAARPTLPVKPFMTLTVTVLEPLAPCAIVRLLGFAESVKSGFDAVFTVTLNVAVCVKAPEVPVRVTVAVPVVAALVAVNVSVLLPVTLLGLNVTPLGRPEADIAMVPVKPFAGLTVRLLVPVAPCTTVALVAERVKSGFDAGFTVMACCSVPVPPPKLSTPAAHTVAVVLVVTAGAVQVNVQEPEALGELCVISPLWTVVPTPAVKVPALVATSTPRLVPGPPTLTVYVFVVPDVTVV
jgi:hypothetical protein